MRTHIKDPLTYFGIPLMRSCVLPALLAGLALQVPAQTFTTLHNFTGGDGSNPHAGLASSGNTLYGTAQYGGAFGYGTLFAVSTDGTVFTTLHTLTGGTEGAGPVAGLTLSGSTLYGTTSSGGNASGTVFAFNTNGTGFGTLNIFNPAEWPSEFPNAGLLLSGNTLYGTTPGYRGVNGTVFAVYTSGRGFTNLHSFTAWSTNSSGVYTNTDGALPYAGLVLSGNTLYGTTSHGGNAGNGTVFSVNTDGTGFTTLHSFAGTRTNSSGAYTNGEGANPYAALILTGNTLYGTTSYGGSGGVGTVFAVNINGTGFTNLHSFTVGGYDPSSNYTNSEGANPYAGLILSGNTLYGTATVGGSFGSGTVFAVSTNGTGFTNLYSFTAGSANSSGLYTNSDGAGPYAGLVLSGDTVYGTTLSRGSSGNGTVFSISFRPRLTITPSPTNIILSWPTNFAGFDYTGYTLRSTTNLFSPASWVTNSDTPVVINGENTVINPITSAQKFYRLEK